MNEVLKKGDFVIVYDPGSNEQLKGLVVYDEAEGSQICVAVLKFGAVCSNYYDKKLIVKV